MREYFVALRARPAAALLLLGSMAGCVLERPDTLGELVEGADAASYEQRGDDVTVARRRQALSEGTTLAISKDTSIRVGAPNRNFGTSLTLDVDRALVEVDGAALAASMGPNDYIESAKLELTLVNDATRAQRLPRQLGAHRVTRPWTEGGATWQCAIDANPSNHAPNCAGETAWSMLGAARGFETSATAVATIPASRMGVVTLDVTSDVRAFVAGTLANRGWLLKTQLGVGNGADFASSESGAGPRLVLTIKRCSAALCDDGNACTTDGCDASASCVNAPLTGTSCDDGSVCTLGDSCAEGVCTSGAARPEGTSCGDGVVCDGTAAQCVPALIVVNEVESSAGVPGDWVELYNAGATAVDISGYRVKDNDDSHAFSVIPAGTVIPAGGFHVVEETALGFGLGGGDSARLFGPTGDTPIDAHAWTSHAPMTYGRCPDGTGAFAATAASTKGAPNDCMPPVDSGVDSGVDAGPLASIVLNEVESNGGTPGDWVEYFNVGTSSVDLSGYRFKDNDDTHAFYALPSGSIVPAGGFLVLEEAQFGFGLGGGDSARLFAPTGDTPVVSYSWTAHASTTYGRCPDGTGDFVTMASSSKGSVNACGEPTDGGVDGGNGTTYTPWPGAGTAQTVDLNAAFGGNLSGLTYQPATATEPSILWAVQNNPSVLFRLVWNGTVWDSPVGNDWEIGKTMVYANGTGVPDAEGVTKAEWDASAVYVATERNNSASSVSRMAILRFDTSDVGDVLTATHEWDLTSDLPATGPNLGLEAITWVPDTYLVASRFVDESTGQPYDPLAYADHGNGLFFVGVEGTGMLYAYALDHVTGTHARIATIASGQVGVMGVEYDRDRNYLFTYCDDTCGNKATLLTVDTNPVSTTFGKFVVRVSFDHPSTLPNYNIEGIAIAPESECTDGGKNVFWTDDGESGGHSLWRDTMSCGPLL